MRYPASKRGIAHSTARTFEVLFYCTNDRDAEWRAARDRYRLMTEVTLLLVAAAGGLYLWQKRRKQHKAVDLPAEEPILLPKSELIEPMREHRPETLLEPQHVVMIRYDDEEIERLLTGIPETGRLTGRELEVLREILRGRKQGEVAYYLGIEVSTVKDFYRKIYDKLGVPNKDGLFRMVSEQLQKS